MPADIRDALLIHNPTAGRRHRRRARDLAEACRILSDAGIAVECRETGAAGEATRLAQEAVRDGRGMVIGCGGDGTINEIVNGLAGSRVPLAILPAGTANVLGKELKLPWKIPAAARQILSGRLERVALGLACHDAPNGWKRYFICVAGAGVDGSMVYSVDSRLKERTGELAYWLTGLSHFLTYRFTAFPVAAGDRSFHAAQVIVSRTKQYAGPFRITPEADLFDNRFEVAVFTSTNRFRYPAHVMQVWLARLQRQSDVHFIKTDRVRCEAVPNMPLYAEIDGEPVGRLPLEFRIVPDALTLVVPLSETQTQSRNVH